MNIFDMNSIFQCNLKLDPLSWSTHQPTETMCKWFCNLNKLIEGYTEEERKEIIQHRYIISHWFLSIDFVSPNHNCQLGLYQDSFIKLQTNSKNFLTSFNQNIFCKNKSFLLFWFYKTMFFRPKTMESQHTNKITDRCG